MTKLLLTSLALFGVLIGTGCERHPASQTVPGFKETQAGNQAVQDKQARTPVAINPNAPKFFPPKKEN
ncbi:MAG: hypothetical protein IAE94_00120 [Chthoniobacterales bacterium]|nr:hypothetical protein [Chthoniobacterales bacterium]